MSYPRARAMRAQVRNNFELIAIAQMWRRVHQEGRSLKCGGNDQKHVPQHAGDANGCADDGSGCICQCHDQP